MTINTQYPIPNTQYPIPNTQYPIPNTQSLIPNTCWYQIPVNGSAVLAPLTLEQLAHFGAGRNITPAQPPADLAQRLGRLIAALAQDPPAGTAEPHHASGMAAPDKTSAVPTGAPRDRRTLFSSLTPGEGRAPCPPLPAGEEPTTQEEPCTQF